MLKSRLCAYDGRGNAAVASPAHLADAWRQLGGDSAASLYAERWVPFAMELAVMVVRSLTGELRAYVSRVCHSCVFVCFVCRRACSVGTSAMLSIFMIVSTLDFRNVPILLIK